jgi:hypothetical protein
MYIKMNNMGQMVLNGRVWAMVLPPQHQGSLSGRGCVVAFKGLGRLKQVKKMDLLVQGCRERGKIKCQSF